MSVRDPQETVESVGWNLRELILPRPTVEALPRSEQFSPGRHGFWEDEAIPL
jgi:hypothetical protein